MRLRAEIAWEREGSSPGFLFDPRHGGVFALNDTARVVLEGVERGLDAEALTRELVRTFEVNELAARGDVRAFLELLQENDLVRA